MGSSAFAATKDFAALKLYRHSSSPLIEIFNLLMAQSSHSKDKLSFVLNAVRIVGVLSTDK